MSLQFAPFIIQIANIESTIDSLQISTLWKHLVNFGDKNRKYSSTGVSIGESSSMSVNGTQNDDAASYLIHNKDGSISLGVDAHIGRENIEYMTFTFLEGEDITESVAKKNIRNKVPVSFTKRGRTAFSPMTVTYPDGTSKSRNFLLEDVIIQHTPALASENRTYGKEYINFGIPEMYIDKIIEDASVNSRINLTVKEKTNRLNGYYWLRCNLEKLTMNNTKILREDNTYAKEAIDSILINMNSSILSNVVFSLSASMNNNDISEELDLRFGYYIITMKPHEVYVLDTTDIEGPTPEDKKPRKKERSEPASSFVARGRIAEYAINKRTTRN